MRKSTRKPVVVRPSAVKFPPVKRDRPHAAEVLAGDHALSGWFKKWLGDKLPTKRQARNFLAELDAKGIFKAKAA